MARLPRVVVVDVPHHVTQRGNARQVILSTDADRITYLELLREYSQLYGFSLLGFCLMSNHVHLIAAPHTPMALAQSLKQVHGRYAAYWNARQRSTGHVWQGRFYSCPLDQSHVWTALRYVGGKPGENRGQTGRFTTFRKSRAQVNQGTSRLSPHFSVKERLLLFLSLLLTSPFLSAQMSWNYSGSSKINFISNFPDCTTGGVNCWHASKLYAAKIFSTNAHTYAIDANGNGYSYNEYPANTWTAHPEWGVVYGLQYGGDGNLYSLYGPGGGTCINQGWHSVGRWNGSGWTQLTYCFASLSVAADGGGQMLAIDGNGTLWIATNYGASGWAHASVPKSTPVISATSINSSLGSYAVVLSDNTIWIYNGSSWAQLTTGGRATQISSDSLGTIYVIGMDQAIYHYNGTGWDRLNGTGNTWLANGGSMEVWAIGPASGGNSIYRFSDAGLQHVRTISGSSTCDQNHFPKCGIRIHTAKLQAGWNSRMGAQQSTQSYANGSLAVSASVDQNDPFACLESDTACQPTTSGNVICPVVGTLYSDSFSNVIFKTELAVSSVTWPGTPPPVGCKTGPCIYLIRSNCTPSTTLPDFNPSTLAGGDYVDWPWSAKTVSWITASFCERILLNGVGITPWVCWPDGPAFPTNINSTPPPYSCTHNP